MIITSIIYTTVNNRIGSTIITISFIYTTMFTISITYTTMISIT